MKYKDFNDSELISYIKEQNEEANEIMYTKYKPLIVTIAKRIYKKSSGIDINDLINEGMLGVFNAILTYKEDLDIPFQAFVKRCVETYLYSFTRHHNRDRDKLLNESISYNNTNDEYNIEDFVTDNKNALINLIDKENKIEVKNYMKEILTPLEYKIFKYRLDGMSIDNIATFLNKDKKNINNALYRIKKKLKENIK